MLHRGGKIKPGSSLSHRPTTPTHDGWATLNGIVIFVLECSSSLAGLGVDEGRLPTYTLAQLEQRGNGHCHTLSQDATGQAYLTLSRYVFEPHWERTAALVAGWELGRGGQAGSEPQGAGEQVVIMCSGERGPDLQLRFSALMYVPSFY